MNEYYQVSITFKTTPLDIHFKRKGDEIDLKSIHTSGDAVVNVTCLFLNTALGNELIQALKEIK